MLNWGLLRPLRRIAQQVAGLRSALADGSPPSPRLIDVRLIARDVAHFAALAQEYYRKHQEASAALAEVRGVLRQITAQQAVMLGSADKEVGHQYQAVLAYANHLEERIGARAADPMLRFDFDDVCESSFNLKLIAGALAQLRSEAQSAAVVFPLAGLIQQTMLALTPSLDRRSMRLTSAEVDESVSARTDPGIVAEVVWMLLLGIVRYAANESVLRIRSFYSQDRRCAMMSIIISELEPGALTAAEREAHLMRQLQHLTPHMFAETIRIHANLQLAELLLRRLDGSIETLPLTTYACEICLRLPAA